MLPLLLLHIRQKVTDTKSGLSEENKTSKI